MSGQSTRILLVSMIQKQTSHIIYSLFTPLKRERTGITAKAVMKLPTGSTLKLFLHFPISF